MNMKTYTLKNFIGANWEVLVYVGYYQHNPLLFAVELITTEGEPLTTASVNLGDYGIFPNSVQGFFIKDYSENEGLFKAMLNAGIIEDAEREVSFGPFDTTAREARLAEGVQVYKLE